MPAAISAPTTVGIQRAVRAWTRTVEPERLVSVPGASAAEQRQLSALGGLAAVLGYQDAPQWPDELVSWAFHAPRPPHHLVELFEQAFSAGLDPLAAAYNASISAANRRLLGTVFTPDDVVEHMLYLVENQLGGIPETVVDPGAGVGAFTLAAARRWPTAQIVAVDVNPVTLGLLGARLAYERQRDPHLADVRVELQLVDYLDALPRIFAPDASGAIVALGNPPYTRTQALAREYKQRARDLACDTITSGHANLAMLFQAVTLVHLRPGDLSCMVLPASMVFTRAARDLRAAMWNSSRPLTVHRWPATRRAFIGREVQAAVVLVGQETTDPGPVRLARVETDAGQVEVIEAWSLPREKDPPTNWYSRLEGAHEVHAGRTLGDLVRVRRGVATGANAFFFLTDDMAAAFEATLLLPAVPSLRHFDSRVLSARTHARWGAAGNRRWLLAVDPEHALQGALLDYVRAHAGLSERYLCRQRPKWWVITDQPRPDILVSPLSDRDFKIVENQLGAVPSNSLLGIWTPPAARAELAGWLRSDEGQTELRRVSRRYQGGSQKIEPGDLRLVRLPSSVADSLRDR